MEGGGAYFWDGKAQTEIKSNTDSRDFAIWLRSRYKMAASIFVFLPVQQFPSQTSDLCSRGSRFRAGIVCVLIALKL